LTYTKIQFSLIFVFFLIDVVWINFDSFAFCYNKNELLYEALFLFSLSVPYLFYKKFRPDPNIVSLLQSFFFLFSYIPLMLILSYLVTTLNQPLVDPFLAVFDRYVGFDAPDFAKWVQNHTIVFIILAAFYNTFLIQFPFIIIYFSFLGETIRLERFFMQFMMAAPLTALIAGLFPALGQWGLNPPIPELLSAFHHVIELRHNILDITTTDGIITFPSFHTIMALFYIYIFRNQRKIIFIPIVITNLLLIFSCVPIGGHYLIDIAGGIFVFIIVVGIERLIFSSLKNGEEEKGVRLAFPKRTLVERTSRRTP